MTIITLDSSNEMEEVIRPSSILTDRERGYVGFDGAFKTHGGELIAEVLIYFAQQRAIWLPFTAEEVNEFYRDIPGAYVDLTFESLESLLVDGFIEHDEASELYYFTTRFVITAYAASPIICAVGPDVVDSRRRDELVEEIKGHVRIRAEAHPGNMLYLSKHGHALWAPPNFVFGGVSKIGFRDGYIVIDPAVSVVDQVPSKYSDIVWFTLD